MLERATYFHRRYSPTLFADATRQFYSLLFLFPIYLIILVYLLVSCMVSRWLFYVQLKAGSHCNADLQTKVVVVFVCCSNYQHKTYPFLPIRFFVISQQRNSKIQARVHVTILWVHLKSTITSVDSSLISSFKE